MFSLLYYPPILAQTAPVVNSYFFSIFTEFKFQFIGQLPAVDSGQLIVDSFGIFLRKMIEIIAKGDTLTVNCTLSTVNCLLRQRRDKQEFGQRLGRVKDPPLHTIRYLFCSSQISSTAISAGLTPEILPACPMDIGRIFCSFSLASTRKPAIAI